MKPLTVFYCDDDDDDLLMFTDIVKEIDESIECVTAQESEKALQLLTEGSVQPDIIFLDINMPRMSGLEILARIKKTKTLTKVPIVMYTTATYSHEINQCIELGADMVLTKLFDPRDTVQQLRKVITNYLPQLTH